VFAVTKLFVLLLAIQMFPGSEILKTVPGALRTAFEDLLVSKLKREVAGRLLYDTVRDGASPAAYHTACDGHSNILTLIWDSEDNVFGGYAARALQPYKDPADWWDIDPGSFLFSVVNPFDNGPLILRSAFDGGSSASVCVFYNPRLGPLFGNGSGFYIHGDSFQTCFTDHRSLACVDTGKTGPNGTPVYSYPLYRYFTLQRLEVWQL
jgi:hypothetical protein